MAGLVGIVAGLAVYWWARESERRWPVLWGLVAWLIVGLAVLEFTTA